MPTLEWIGKSKVINHHQDVPFRVLERNWIGDSINLVAVDATMSKEKAKQLLTAGADRIAAPTVLGWL